MADAPGRVRFPTFSEGEPYDSSKMRELTRALEIFLSRIRMDGSIIIGGGRTISKYFSRTVTWNPASVASGAQVTTTVTVTGVRLSEYNTVTVGFNKDLQAMQLTGHVSADDTITVVLRNGTAGSIDLAEGSLTVGIWRHG